MLKFLHCFRDAEEWDRIVPSSDPHFSSALYRVFGGNGQLAVFERLVQPFYNQDPGWVGNVHNFGGPIGDQSLQGQFERAFGEWKLLNNLNERCTLNPFLDQVVSYPTESRNVVYIDLEHGPDLRPTTRHCIAKAAKAGAITWQAEPCVKNAMIFEEMYHDAMQKKGAALHWTYRTGFFHDLFKELGPKRSALFFTSIVGGGIESGCVLIFGPDVCYYHWAARKGNVRDVGIDHLQVWSTANWAQALHMKKFHLGGGLKPDDGLFTFKAGFSNLRLPCRSYVTKSGVV